MQSLKKLLRRGTGENPMFILETPKVVTETKAIKVRIGEFLDRLMVLYGLSPGVLAEKLGISKASLMGLLQRRRLPRLFAAMKIAALGSVTLDELLNDDDCIPVPFKGGSMDRLACVKSFIQFETDFVCLNGRMEAHRGTYLTVWCMN